MLSRGTVVAGKYRIQFCLGAGVPSTSHRVQDLQGHVLFLKLLDLRALPLGAIGSNAAPREISLYRQLHHVGIPSLRDSGETVIEGVRYAYLVTDFVSGETLEELLAREHTLPPHEAKHQMIQLLDVLDYLHSQEDPVLHNALCPQHMLLDLSSGGAAQIRLAGFGAARYMSQPLSDYPTPSALHYVSNEALQGVYSAQSDIYAAGALYYQMLMGAPPYLSATQSDNREAHRIAADRSRALPFSDGVDEHTRAVLRRALSHDVRQRFATARAFRDALMGEVCLDEPTPSPCTLGTVKSTATDGRPSGFDAIVGMHELKEMLRVSVIEALHQRDKYREYGLEIPNGLLLYGPPGCGKTFFAERLAEELGFHFYQVKPSDVQSRYVNASQENLKELFDQARASAPSLIFFDELDAIAPSRDSSNLSHMNATVVNELLVQMNNCGEDRVFVIGATNRPRAIDAALLRTGRLDRQVYVPPPDRVARAEMFRMYLQHRPTDLGIPYDELAEATEGYVASDIRYLVDEAARCALQEDAPITHAMLLSAMSHVPPSLSAEELASYMPEEAHADEPNPKRRIGFK